MPVICVNWVQNRPWAVIIASIIPFFSDILGRYILFRCAMLRERPQEEKREKTRDILHTSMGFHPTSLLHAEQIAMRRPPGVDADHVRPKQCPGPLLPPRAGRF